VSDNRTYTFGMHLYDYSLLLYLLQGTYGSYGLNCSDPTYS